MAIDPLYVLQDLKSAEAYYQSLSRGPEDRDDIHAKLLRDARTLLQLYRSDRPAHTGDAPGIIARGKFVVTEYRGSSTHVDLFTTRDELILHFLQKGPSEGWASDAHLALLDYIAAQLAGIRERALRFNADTRSPGAEDD